MDSRCRKLAAQRLEIANGAETDASRRGKLLLRADLAAAWAAAWDHINKLLTKMGSPFKEDTQWMS